MKRHVLTLAFLVLCLSTNANVFIPNEELFKVVGDFIAEGKSVSVIAPGNSMRPFIWDQERVLLEKAETYEVGDIVLAHHPEFSYVLHRINSISNNEVVLMGDGNLKGQERCPMDSIKAICRTKYDSIGNAISLDSDIQKARAELWRKLLPSRQRLLSIYQSSEDSAFWKEQFQTFLLDAGKLEIRPAYQLYNFGDKSLLIHSAESNIDLSHVITLNATAAYLFERMKDRRFTIQNCIEAFTEEYDIQESQATYDCINLLTNWFSLGIIKIP